MPYWSRGARRQTRVYHTCANCRYVQYIPLAHRQYLEPRQVRFLHLQPCQTCLRHKQLPPTRSLVALSNSSFIRPRLLGC